MTRKHLLIGISAAALAAGTAAAQTNNTATENCGQTSGANSTCDVNNNASGNTDNTGTITQRGGGGNVAFITQVGDENFASIDQNGDNNGSRITQNGDDHFAVNNQTGFENFSTIDQGDDENSATVNQTTTNGTRGSASGSTTNFDNQSFVAQGTGFQGGGATPASAPTSSSGTTAGTATPTDTQGFSGENNVVNVSQNGTNLVSSILQAANMNGTTGPSTTDPATGIVTPGVTTGRTGQSADFNTANVIQSGIGSSSTITQRSNRNSATVRLFDGGRNTDATLSTTATTQRNTSVVNQTNSTVVQTGTDSSGNGTFTGGGFNSGAPTSGTNPNVGSTADVAISGQGNSSTINQDGVLNNARVSLLNGGGGEVQPGARGSGGETITAGRRQGNSTSITQTGINNSARVGSGGRAFDFGGSGNVSTITQGGASVGANATGSNVGRNHSATVFQSGTLDTVTINQQNNTGQNTVSGTGNQNGSIADVAQRTLNSSASITQLGSNFARLSQGGGESGNNSATINQTDAGDRQGTPQQGGDIFTQPGTGPNTFARNEARFSQAGITNSGTINQNAIGASATIFQRLNSRSNLAQINQGSGATDIDLTARIEQAGRGSSGANGTSTPAGSSSSATINQSGRAQTANIVQTGNRMENNVSADSGNVATINQQTSSTMGAPVSNNNNATITQTGFMLSATITQNGAGSTSTAARDLRNQVTISQTGDRHTATATQESTVRPSSSSSPGGTPASGPSGTEFARGSGQQSAEIQIIQSGSRGSGETSPGNSATVTQQGEGQFARILQEGRQNTAGILQGPNATNAVAVIEQRGSNNQFFITQNTAGQFFRATQNGNNNSNTTIVASGPNGGGQTSSGANATQPTNP